MLIRMLTNTATPFPDAEGECNSLFHFPAGE